MRVVIQTARPRLAMHPESLPVFLRVESALLRFGAWISWIWLGLIAVIATSVVLRFAFGLGRIELEELQWHLYAVGFLIGITSAASVDRHVRVDVFRERMQPRTRAWVDLYGILLLQIPFVALVLWSATPFVADSFAVAERSAAAGGLAARWLLKAMLPLSFSLLAIATLARLARVVRVLVETAGGPTAPPTHDVSARPGRGVS